MRLCFKVSHCSLMTFLENYPEYSFNKPTLRTSIYPIPKGSKSSSGLCLKITWDIF